MELAPASVAIGDAAPKIVLALPAKSVAPLASAAQTNARRVITPGSSFAPKSLSPIQDK
jgi:hypothetical protein